MNVQVVLEQSSRPSDGDLSSQFFAKIPIGLCREHGFCLERLEDSQVRLVILPETKPFIRDMIGRVLGKPLEFAVRDRDAIDLLINEGYERHRTQHVAATPSTPSSNADVSVNDGEDNDLLREQSEAPVIELVNRLLFEAVQQQASDIHFQPHEGTMVARFRVDGVLFDHLSIPKAMQEEVLTRIKVSGRMDIAEKRLPQDGRATVRVGNRVIDLRIASMPSSHGERIVVRLLDKSARLYKLPELGMDERTLARFRHVISVEHGLVLVTGPTGSGKSTTLYAALQELDTKRRNAVTLEDPIEYQLDGISQTQINVRKGMTFAGGLRSILRQDPDIIMVGEIRDGETAMLSVQAALTGHLVFSTLHTNDAASAVTRLLDLGIEPYLLSSSLVAVLAQRLVRRLCPACKQRTTDGERRFVPTGCLECRQTGYRGRLGIYELLTVDEDLRSLITRRSRSTEIRDSAVSKGMHLLREGGNLKVAEGATTLEEVERVTMRAEM